jgi:hypothetical protein
MTFIFHCNVCLLDSYMSFIFSRNVNLLKILIQLPDVLFAVPPPRKSCFRFQQGLAEAQQPVEKNWLKSKIVKTNKNHFKIRRRK